MTEVFPDRLLETRLQTRFWGFDILRIISMIAVICFHSNETTFFTDDVGISGGIIFPVLVNFTKVFAISGFTIVALTSFLYAIREPVARVWYRLFLLLGAGIMVLAWLAGDGLMIAFVYEWDIYSYLLLTLAVMFIVRKSRIAIRVLGLFGFLLLLFPIWKLSPSLLQEHRFLMAATVGDCQKLGGGGWPILPWSGLMWMFYALGREWATNLPLRNSIQARIGIVEGIVAIALIAISIPFLGEYMSTPWGPGFGCYMFRQPPLIFWAHFVWIMLWMRLSMLNGFNDWLARKRWVQFISNLKWSKQFGRCYLVQLVYVGIGSSFASHYISHPWLFDLFVVGTIPICEMVVRWSSRWKTLPFFRKTET